MGKEVQADGKVEVAGIEIDRVLGPGRRNEMQQFLGEVAVWINQPDAVSGGDVLHDEITQERGFPRTRLADEVEMLALVVW